MAGLLKIPLATLQTSLRRGTGLKVEAETVLADFMLLIHEPSQAEIDEQTAHAQQGYYLQLEESRDFTLRTLRHNLEVTRLTLSQLQQHTFKHSRLLAVLKTIREYLPQKYADDSYITVCLQGVYAQSMLKLKRSHFQKAIRLQQKITGLQAQIEVLEQWE